MALGTLRNITDQSWNAEELSLLRVQEERADDHDPLEAAARARVREEEVDSGEDAE